MIDSAFDALVHQRLHLVLSSDRPLALQHSALLLLRRLHQERSVRVADEAPADPTELITHVNQIVAGLSLRQATDNVESVSRLAILPVRVGPDRPADSIALLIRLCRALPGTGLRLLLIIEHEPAVEACMRALSGAAYHWDIRPQPAADVNQLGIAAQALALHPNDDAQALPASRAEPVASTQRNSQPDNTAAPQPTDTSAQPLKAPSANPLLPVSKQAGWFSKLADSASRRPLRFALVVAGIPGLLIALVLAVGSALQPSRSGSPSLAAGSTSAAPAPAPARSIAASAPSPAPAPQPPDPAAAAAPPPATAPAPASNPTTAPNPTQATPAATAKPASAPPSQVAAKAPVSAPVQAPVSPAPQPSVPPAAQTVVAAPVASSVPAAPPVAATAPVSNAPSVERRPAPESTAAASSPPVPAFECTPATTPPPQVQPRNPSKDGGMVYLTSTRPVMVCVTDASGTITRQQITPDQGQSFFGKAPWQVQAASLRDLQFFFQGARIVVPRNATDRIELIERTN